MHLTPLLFVLAARVTIADGPAVVRTALLVHVLAGATALVSGFLALHAAKGSAVHRKSGVMFVYSMVTMGLLGVAINLFQGEEWADGLVVAYFVISALTTVRPPTVQRRRLEVGGMLLAACLGAASLVIGIAGVTGGEVARDEVPAGRLFIGTVLLLTAAGDLRVIRAGGLRGRPRLVRHLWRMCFALFTAAFSFFIGQSRLFPEPLRNLALLAVPVLVPLVAMPYWLWRLRSRRPPQIVFSAGGGDLFERSARTTTVAPG
jgi:uncharacterized membrane protein